MTDAKPGKELAAAGLALDAALAELVTTNDLKAFRVDVVNDVVEAMKKEFTRVIDQHTVKLEKSVDAQQCLPA